MKRLLAIFLAALVLGAGAIAGLWILTFPSHDRDWIDDHARLTDMSSDGRLTHLQNVRDWRYADDGPPTARNWVDVAFDPADLRQVWFVVEPFTGSNAIAHTMMSFEFADGRAFVASIEARREKGEDYQAFRAALIPTFEYLVVWTTERDMFANSELWAKDDLYLYPLSIPLTQQRAVLDAVLERTKDVALHPRWYNTLFANCTNVLARAVNKVAPGAVPLDKAWVLTGYADDFLFRLGLIGPADTFADLEKQAFISPLIRPAFAAGGADGFSPTLRRLLAAR